MKQFMILIALFLAAQSALAWDLAEVSVLMPLPKTIGDVSKLLSTADQGGKGELLPAPIVRILPKLVFGTDKNQTYFKDLRLVGIRFDPCFFEGTGPVLCRHQIRMVWQPIVLAAGQVTTKDATLHTFYEFDDASFHELIVSYQTLLKANPAAPQPTLGRNSRLVAQGLNGAFARGLKALILKSCGAENLVRATVMTLEKGENEWNFMGWNLVRGVATPISIAIVNAPVQVLKTKVTKDMELKATVNPEGLSRDASAIYADSASAKLGLSSRQLETFSEDILNIQNPGKSNPGTVDCASCHMTEPGNQWARLSFPAWDWNAMVLRSGFETKRDVRNLTLANLKPRRFRAFGYFGADPLIAQRTINESALVADALDQAYP